MKKDAKKLSKVADDVIEILDRSIDENINASYWDKDPKDFTILLKQRSAICAM